MGRVYRATCADSLETVAIKILREDGALMPPERARLRTRFRREMALCARLHHKNVVALLDSGETQDGRLFAVFEYVAGRTLREMLAADGALSAITMGMLMLQVLDGLASAHRSGVVHRDLKPQNVIVTTVGGELSAKILDFGIGALLSNARGGNESAITQSTEVLGSPQYCSPEQLRGEPLTAKSDLYAWGLVVIECLIGRPVIQGDSIAEILYRQLSPVDVALPASIAAHPLGTVLRSALNKDPRQRAESAEALAERFRAIHFEALVGAMQYSSPRREPRRTASSSAGVAAGRRQLTVLCCRVTLVGNGASVGETDQLTNEDALDAYEAQWLTRCADIAVRYGGHVCGSLGDTQMFFFGYPEGIDRPAQRACRAALDVIREAARFETPDRQAALSGDHSITSRCHIEVAAALHVGSVLVRAASLPTGVTASAAAGLLRLAPAGRILLSDEAARVVERHVDLVDTPLRFAVAGRPAQPVRELLGERDEHAPFASLEHTISQPMAPNAPIVPMIGRDRECAELLNAWQRTIHDVACHGDERASRARRATLVVGDAGIGKSRLIHALREKVRAHRQAVADCVCLPEQLNQALFPILRFVDAHWLVGADRTNLVSKLDRLLEPLDCDRAAARAALGTWLGFSGSSDAEVPGSSDPRQRQTLFDVLCRLIASLGGGGPVLLIVEDVQWADCATLEFLDELLRHPHCERVCVMLTSRAEQLARWRGKVKRVVLRRLPRTGARSLIEALLGEVSLDDASFEWLEKCTAGVPLFIEEVIRELQLAGMTAAQHATLRNLAAQVDCRLPGSLREMLELALERVDGAREALQLAATIGLEADERLIGDASSLDFSALDEELRRLVEGRILYSRHRLGGVTYVFRHALLREAAYESMPGTVRRACHERVARALSARSGCGDAASSSLRIAEHFARAQMFAEAVHYGIKAARHALERALHDDATRYAQTVQGWLQHADYSGREDDAVANDMTLAYALMARDR
jgi:TOMM system kinase/cyclase fusion protein